VGLSGLDVAAVDRAVAGTRFAGQMKHFPSLGSTNSLAIAEAQAGAREGVWIADEQTSGRGRGGHTWHSVAGDGLYVSVLVIPGVPAARALWISMATGLAARRAIAEASGLAADLRWPNDLMLHGRKCGGVLVESAIAAGGEVAEGMRYAVIGVGINVNHAIFPEEMGGAATSLRMEAGREIAREQLLISLLRALDFELGSLQAEHSVARSRQEMQAGGGLLERFAAASSWVRGKRVRVGEMGGYTGVTAGLNRDGYLLVDAAPGDGGERRTVLSGGVRELE